VSELQWALAAFGAVVVGAVWGYNRWQERRQRYLTEAMFAGQTGDVLPTAGEAAPAEERREPVIDDGGSLPPLPEAWADEMVDCVVRLEFKEPMAAANLLQFYAEWAGQLDRPVQWLGLDPMLHHWRQLTDADSGRYPVVCAALQLADRRGPIDEAGVATFLDAVRELLRRTGCVAELPAADDVLMHARAVDQACIAVDMQLALNVVPASGRPFDGAAFRHALEESGYSLRDDGSCQAADELFSVVQLGGEPFEEFPEDAMEKGVTLTLDVPRVADGALAFDRLLALVGDLATRFDSALVDGQRNALSAEAIAAIRAKIGELQSQMVERRIAPGSVRARRLFS
jgi:hypothetical protein